MLITEADIDKLSTPITDDAFCGIYLKGERQLYRPLRNEFNLALTSLRKLTQNPDVGELEALHEENAENWSQISTSLFKVFETQTRDIELIGWMLASTLILDSSLASFAKTLKWTNSLLSEHWQSLQPILPQNKRKSDSEKGQQDEVVEAKLKAFTQLLGESEESSLLYAPILMSPIVGNITFYQYQSAEKRGELSVLRTEAAHVVADCREEITALVSNISSAQQTLEEMASFTRHKATEHGVNAPSFAPVLSMLNKLSQAITQLSGVRQVAPTTASTSGVEANTDTNGTSTVENAAAAELTASNQQAATQNVSLETLSATAQVLQGGAQVADMQSLTDVANMNSTNRDAAFRQLRQLADYFRTSEPHSPVAYLIEKAIRWGYMPLPELLNEMLTENQQDMKQIFSSAGLDNTQQTTLPTPVVNHTTHFDSVASKAAGHIAPDSGMTDASATVSTDAESKQHSETENTSAKGTSSGLRW